MQTEKLQENNDMFFTLLYHSLLFTENSRNRFMSKQITSALLFPVLTLHIGHYL